MRPVLFVPPLTLLLLACARPEVAAFRANPTPLTVAYRVDPSVPDAPALEKEYAAALRARLATRVTVVPEGAPGPPHPVRVTVEILDIETHNRPSGLQAGMATGVAVGLLGTLAGNRNAVFDGFFWGLFAGSHVAAANRRDQRYLGYRPRLLRAEVRVTQDGLPDPLCDFAIQGEEVVDAMDPLHGPDRDDQIRIREEEAKAMARVVVGHLQERFGWSPKPTPSYYLPEPAPALTPAPAQRDAPATPPQD